MFIQEPNQVAPRYPYWAVIRSRDNPGRMIPIPITFHVAVRLDRKFNAATS